MIDLPNPGADILERYREIVPDWDAFIDAASRPLPLFLWTNALRTTPERVAKWLACEGIDAQPVSWWSSAFKGAPSERAGQCVPFVAGLYHIQEEVSCLPIALLDPRPDERVLDLCAAPGSKSAQIAVGMGNSGTLISNDRDGVRHRATRGTLDRLGVANATITVHDASDFPEEAGPFDRVLADVPCTCEGTSRKNRSAFLGAGLEASERMATRQLAILRRAVALCRAGGRVVYATCTYAPEENELIVDALLREAGDSLDLLPARVADFSSSPGLTSWRGKDLDPRLQRAMRVWPHQNDTGGFFVAVIEKTVASGSGSRAALVTDRAGGSPVPPSTDTIGDSTSPSATATRGDSASAAASDTSAGSGEAPEWLPAEREAEWLGVLTSRFGIPAAAFEPFRLVRASKKYVAVVSRSHRPGAHPPAVSTGLPLIRAQLEYPKLTTAGAMLFGEAATRNVVEVSEAQAAAYMAREEFLLDEAQEAGVVDTGYVLIRRNGVSLGVALCYLDERRVLSMYPKVLSRAVSD